MGAGSITSNVKSDKTNVVIKYEGDKIETGLKKMGAILGNYVEVGCNSVLNPGTVIGKNSVVYPLSSVRGCVAANSIYKNQENVIVKENRDAEAEAVKAEAEEPAPKPKRTRAKKSTAASSSTVKVVK